MIALRACFLGLLSALCVTGCGGPSETDRVKQTVKLFADSTAQHDYTVLCQKVLAPELISKLKPFNLSCEIAVRQYFGDVRNPRVDIRRIRLVGKDGAVAAVQSSAAGQAPAAAELGLVKTRAGWRIARLASGGATARPCPQPGKGAPPDQPCVGPPPGTGPSSPSTPND
ncbi:MAG: hypothetical protein ACR2K9_00075 [Solirubrobacteraceae bacterium]